MKYNTRDWVTHKGLLWESRVDVNKSEPGTDNNWFIVPTNYYKGPFNAAFTGGYFMNDIVQANQSFYRSKTDNNTAALTDATHWETISQAVTIENIEAALGFTPANDANVVHNTAIGASNGIAPLDGNGLLPVRLFPDNLLGNVKYKGTYNGSIITSADNAYNGLVLPPSTDDIQGVYFIATSPFTLNDVSYATGDWIISDGASGGWNKVANSDAVTTVFGRNGNILANTNDYASFYQPKEDQRLSMANDVRFASIVSPPTVGNPNSSMYISSALGLVSGNVVTGELAQILPGRVQITKGTGLEITALTGDSIQFQRGSFNIALRFPTITAGRTINLRDGDGDLAFLSDLEAPGVVAENDALAQTASFTALTYAIPIGVDAVFRAEFSVNITTTDTGTAVTADLSIAFTDIYNVPQTIKVHGWPVRGSQDNTDIVFTNLGYFVGSPVNFKAKAGTTINALLVFTNVTTGVMDLYSTLIRVR